MSGGSFAQRVLSKKGEIAVAGIIVESLVSGENGDLGRREIGVHVFEAEDLGIMGRVGCIAHPIYANAGKILEPGNRDGTSSRLHFG